MKTKKLFSFVLVVILLVGCVGITAYAADETVTVSLLGEKQAVATEEYEVMINVDETVVDLVGGISCDVVYDERYFELDRIEITTEFATHNKLADDLGNNEIINNNKSGRVSVVLLDVPDDGAKSNWLTLVFDVTAVQESYPAQFKLENVKLSNSTGTNLVTNDLAVEVTDVIYDHILDLNGASIRKDGVGNIRFEAEIESGSIDMSEVIEVGFLMIPAACLKGDLYNGDLTFTDSGKYTTADGRTVTIATNAKEGSRIADGDKIYCYLTNTTSFKLNTTFAARAYIKIDDGTEEGLIIYSDNQTYIEGSKIYEKNIKGGTSSKNCIETAKAIIELYNVTDLKSYLTADTATWTENYTDIVERLAEVEDSFN